MAFDHWPIVSKLGTRLFLQKNFIGQKISRHLFWSFFSKACQYVNFKKKFTKISNLFQSSLHNQNCKNNKLTKKI